MSKSPKQKLKLLYLMRFFHEKTDELHRATMQDILLYLEQHDIMAERKSIYDDIELLIYSGMDIIKQKEKDSFCYYLASRQFELAELKLLVDAVQASKFVTAKKSNQLIKKIESLVSVYDASQLQRQVFVTERIKTMNESIYYNVDKIHSAIGKNVVIDFLYCEWTLDKKMKPKKDGVRYSISPWALSWDDENYYMIGFDDSAKMIKHYRVDKMQEISLIEEARAGKEYFLKFDMAVYAKKMFGMFGAVEEHVTLEFKNELAGVVIDRFGKDIIICPKNNQTFTVTVTVAASRQFLAWVFGLGEGVRILSPENLVTKMREEARRLMEQYD